MGQSAFGNLIISFLKDKANIDVLQVLHKYGVHMFLDEWRLTNRELNEQGLTQMDSSLELKLYIFVLRSEWLDLNYS